MAPFGFEERLVEEKLNSYKDNNDSEKTYIDVTVNFSKEGVITPLHLHTEDGQILSLKVIKKSKGNSLKDRLPGMIYTCKNENTTFKLFFDGSKFYIKSKSLQYSDNY